MIRSLMQIPGYVVHRVMSPSATKIWYTYPKNK